MTEFKPTESTVHKAEEAIHEAEEDEDFQDALEEEAEGDGKFTVRDDIEPRVLSGMRCQSNTVTVSVLFIYW